MSELASTTGVTQAYTRYKHVPFTAFMKVVPIRGKRFETIRDLEIQGNLIEGILDNLCDGTGEIVFDYTKPVAFTPQYGDKPARFSFNGHICRRETFEKLFLGQATTDTNQTGFAYNNSNYNTTATFNTIVYNFKNLLESNVGLDLIRLEVAGYIFGQGGAHFPIG